MPECMDTGIGLKMVNSLIVSVFEGRAMEG